MTEDVKTTEDNGVTSEQLSATPDTTEAAGSETVTTTEQATTDTEGKPAESADSKTNEGEELTATTDESETAEEAVVRVVPEVTDYKLPDGVPQDVAQFAHDNDMTQEQLDASLMTFGGYIQAIDEGTKSKISDEGHKLADSWGDERDFNLTLVQRALKQNDPDGTLEAVLNETGYGNHPAVLNFLLSLGQSMKEGGFLKGAVHTPNQRASTASKMFGNHPSDS